MLYFIRHGQSEANAQGIFAGQRDDSPLTKLGLEQARLAAEEIGRSLDITKIISSPLLRAISTAEIIAAGINYPKDIIFDDRAMEYDVGDLTGMIESQITIDERSKPHGGEDPLDFRHRVEELIRDLSSQEGNALLVSHAAVGKMITVIKDNLDTNRFFEVQSPANAVLIQID